ncbi:hypothetical protein ACJU26_09370 [Acidithiobacillus sp. M4-SHS-6]|uniref:hypothetical protein n=1 Tax=Acidithiobacillus sp. M4-SHS-6 TaxID=3383024 RepID=UPI0039BEC0F3
MKISMNVLESAEFKKMVKERGKRIYGNQRKFLSPAVVDVDDVCQEFYLAAYRVLRLDKEYMSLNHFFNTVTIAVYNHLKSEYYRGTISHTGIHTVDLRKGPTPADPRKQLRDNIALSMQATPLSLQDPLAGQSQSGGDMMRDETIGEDAIAGLLPSLSDVDLAVLMDKCPHIYAILNRDMVPPSRRRVLPDTLANELLDYVDSGESLDSWTEELSNSSREAVRAAATRHYKKLQENYRRNRESGESRINIIMGLITAHRIPLYEFLGLLFLVCETGRGARGPYHKRRSEK